MSDVNMKVGDLLPELTVLLVNGDKSIPATGAWTGIFVMENSATGVKKIAAGVAQLVDATIAKWKYVWAGTDTDTAGDFLGEFVFTQLDGRQITFPGPSTDGTRGSQISIHVGVRL